MLDFLKSICNQNQYLYGFILGIIAFFAALQGLDATILILDRFKVENSKYIKKTDVSTYLKENNNIAVENNSYILKTDFNKYLSSYLKENKETLIKEDYINDIEEVNDKLINSNKKLKTQLKKKNEDINKLKKKIQYSKNTLEKTYYANDLKTLPLLFIINTSNIDIKSKEKLKKLKSLNIHKSVIAKIDSCKNNFETFSIKLSKERVNLIKNSLKEFINIRRIRIDNVPNCEDPFNDNIFNEDENRLVLGIAVTFDSNNHYN